jgi:hypothetical protein
MNAASGRTRNELRVSRSAPVKDHEHVQLLVGAEAVLSASLDEHGRAFRDFKRHLLDLRATRSLRSSARSLISLRDSRSDAARQFGCGVAAEERS